jgi:hypothetical protein
MCRVVSARSSTVDANHVIHIECILKVLIRTRHMEATPWRLEGEVSLASDIYCYAVRSFA